MKVSYTGRHDVFPPKQRVKLDAKLQKMSKQLDRNGEREAHVILALERHLHKVEITVNAFGHAMVGCASDSDVVIAAHSAFDKLEKQVVKLRTRWRDVNRHKAKEAEPAAPKPVAAAPKTRKSNGDKAPPKAAAGNHRKKVFRVDNRDGKKPMNLEEAMLEMEASQDYMVYRDAQTDRVTVLMRRPDGHFDLIES